MAEGDDVDVEQLKNLAVGGDEEVTPGYKAPAKVDLKTLQQMDADDESLVKYKADLLKGAEGVVDEGGSNVLVKFLSIVFVGTEQPPIKLDLSKLDEIKKNPVTIKEGTSYKLQIDFRVQREIVAGLRFFNVTSRKGITVDKANYMVGSYGPKTEMQSFSTQPEETPSGLISRGTYHVKSKFTDDDKNVYLEWEWMFAVKKSWS